MNQLDYQRRQQVSKRRDSLEASSAVDTLLKLGWTSATFADVAAGIKIEELEKTGARKLARDESFVDIRLTPAEAIALLKAIGGTVKSGATNGEVAGAIAQRANLLNQKPRKAK
jgi:hypothetical protein